MFPGFQPNRALERTDGSPEGHGGDATLHAGRWGFTVHFSVLFNSCWTNLCCGWHHHEAMPGHSDALLGILVSFLVAMLRFSGKSNLLGKWLIVWHVLSW